MHGHLPACLLENSWSLPFETMTFCSLSPLHCLTADDTQAVMAAIAAASQAAAKLTTVDCGTPLRPKRCPVSRIERGRAAAAHCGPPYLPGSVSFCWPHFSCTGLLSVLTSLAVAWQVPTQLSSPMPFHPTAEQAPTNGFGNEGRSGVAVLLPAGRYRITGYIEIMQSNVVVRGEGVRAPPVGLGKA